PISVSTGRYTTGLTPGYAEKDNTVRGNKSLVNYWVAFGEKPQA
ncbi:hypothetical protein RRG08_055674, partial [Elysia crispata]